MRILTVGHSTADADALRELLTGAGVELVVDVRRVPASRRHPHVRREALARWLPAAGIAYRWEGEALGGWRRPRPDSPHTALRSPGFRGYADHMDTVEFRAALERVLADAARRTTAVMCAEALWFRCHRMLLADALTLLGGAEVLHLSHQGDLEPHRPTRGVRVVGGTLRYDEG